MAGKRKALIAGATGAASVRLVALLGNDPGWEVLGLCRRPPLSSPGAGVRYAAVDLADGAAVRRIVDAEPGITHVFYCCRAAHGETGVESVPANVAMLAGILDAVAHADTLEHVHLVEGGKWYGMHLGAFPTPACEDDPRHLPPNFYYDQEDMLRERQKGQRWAWSASRPNFITDDAPDRPRNLVAVLGAWAAFCKECGMALDFPGRPAAFTALAELTDATHYARAMRHIATTPACANQAFNVTNGEPCRWQRVWPRLARLYGLEIGTVRPMRLAHWMADKEPLWQRMVTRYDLKPQPLAAVANWQFADFALNLEHDIFYSTTRLRQSGFGEAVDTIGLLMAQIEAYQRARIIP